MAKDELSEFLSELKKDVARACDGVVDEVIKDEYEEEVERMYSEYDRKCYQPRYEKGGFLDRGNWDEDVKIMNDGILYALINETEAVNQSSMRLDQIIETGKGYNWNGQPPPRPVYERTNERLENSDVVEDALESYLKSQGWELK